MQAGDFCQIFAWTLVPGFIFLYKVYTDPSIPKFDSATLALLAISAGAYVGN
jgi:hypothetical protein